MSKDLQYERDNNEPHKAMKIGIIPSVRETVTEKMNPPQLPYTR